MWPLTSDKGRAVAKSATLNPKAASTVVDEPLEVDHPLEVGEEDAASTGRALANRTEE